MSTTTTTKAASPGNAPTHGLGYHGRHEREPVGDPAAAGATPTGTQRPWATTLIACLGILIAYLPITATAVALATIARALNASTSDLQWVSDAFSVAMAAVVLPAGIVGDVHGRKKVFVGGLVISLIGAVIGLSAQNVPTLWVAEAVMGVGAACLLPSSLALISHAVPNPHERARHISVWAASLGVGLGAGGVTAGWILDHAAWRWLFAPTAVGALVFAVIAAFLLGESRAPRGRTLDWPGQILGTVAAASVVYAVIEGGNSSWTGARCIGGFVVAAVAVFGFIAVERNVDSPMLDLSLFRHRRFTGAVLVAVIGMFGLIGSLFVLSLFFGSVQHLSALGVAWRVGGFCLALVIAGPLAGALMRTIHPVVLMVTGVVIAAGGLFWCATIDPTSGLWPTVARMAVTGFGLGILFTPMTATAVSAVGHHQIGMAGAALNALRQIGGAFGPAVLGAVLTARATAAIPGLLERSGASPAGAAQALATVNGAGLNAAAARPYGSDTAAIGQAFAQSFTHAVHVCTFIAACALVAGAVLLVVVDLLPVRDRTEHPADAGAAVSG